MDILDAGFWQHRGETEDGIVELGDADEASDGKMLESGSKGAYPSEPRQPWKGEQPDDGWQEKEDGAKIEDESGWRNGDETGEEWVAGDSAKVKRNERNRAYLCSYGKA